MRDNQAPMALGHVAEAISRAAPEHGPMETGFFSRLALTAMAADVVFADSRAMIGAAAAAASPMLRIATRDGRPVVAA
jgi:hypothetical protein